MGAAMLDIGIFVLVFWMHGGTMTGGMSAAVAALILLLLWASCP